jgi:integrase
MFSQMAAITFLYRSNKPIFTLSLRFSHLQNGANYNLVSPTKFYISREYWEKHHKLQRVKDAAIKAQQRDVNEELNNLSDHVLSAFRELPGNQLSERLNSDWLKATLYKYYNPKESALDVPRNLPEYVDYYIQLKEKEQREGLKKGLGESAVKKYGVIKNKLQRFESFLSQKLFIEDINASTIQDFIRYSKGERYAESTIIKDVTMIKTLCYSAEAQGIEVSSSLKNFTTESQEDNTAIFLNPEEIKSIQNLTGLTDYLDNARDWLVISCYTGQRISDFMYFKGSDITKRINNKGNEVWSIIIKQRKTGEDVKIILNDIIPILNKRDGEFPRQISDQKYNDYIKEVAKKAKLLTSTYGGVVDPKTKRKEFGQYPKWQLVSSHIGRRSFATNNYGKMPLQWLMSQTGHTTEKSLKTYICKTHSDYAEEYEESI